MNLYFWIPISFAVLFSGYVLFSFFRIRGLIRESATLINESKPYERFVSAKADKVLFIGDSTGVGVGASSPDDSVAGRFGADYPEMTIENLSISGRKTAEIIPDLKKIPKNSYEYVIIQVGGNDIIGFTNIEKLKSNLDVVLSEAKRIGEKVLVMTSGNVGNAPIFPRPIAFLLEKQTRKVREVFIKKTSNYNAVYIDLFKEKINDLFSKEPLKYHAKDLFHPNSDGYGLWYQNLKNFHIIDTNNFN